MQEYFCSFDLGVEGSYYAKYLDRMRVKGQIGIVPWESSFKVHTAWDLGTRDSSVIIFFQTIGQTVRIIDYYEKNKEKLLLRKRQWRLTHRHEDREIAERRRARKHNTQIEVLDRGIIFLKNLKYFLVS